MARIAFENVVKRFGSTTAVAGFDLQVEDGEFIVLVGPSGCGKTTSLRMLAGLETVTEGTILVDGRDVTDVPPRARNMAMVFQSYALYPHLTVAENMGFALKLSGMGRTEIGKRVAEAAALLEIGQLLDRKPSQLSGGQKQRVAVCRAIVRSPAVFLFDEPLSNLDSQLRATARAEIRALQRRIGTTSVYVTHDQVEAMTMADRIVVMRDGFVQQIGTPLEIFEEPANVFVAGFIGSPGMNLLPARFGEGLLHLGEAALPLVLMGPPRDLLVGLRPEALRPESEGPLSLSADTVEMLGAECLVHARLAGAPLLLRLPREVSPASGTTARFGWAPGALHLFEAADGRRIDAGRHAAALEAA